MSIRKIWVSPSSHNDFNSLAVSGIQVILAGIRARKQTPILQADPYNLLTKEASDNDISCPCQKRQGILERWFMV